jgi:hypothetical protein
VAGGEGLAICAPAQLPELFAETPIPSGPITDAVTEAIAKWLLEAAEENKQNGDHRPPGYRRARS